jgi:hypothetical protein
MLRVPHERSPRVPDRLVAAARHDFGVTVRTRPDDPVAEQVEAIVTSLEVLNQRA